MLPQGIVTDFSTITRYDLSSYLNTYVDFIENKRQDIVDYYSGSVDKPNINSFNTLSNLISSSGELNNQIELHKDRFNVTSYWELIETLSDIQTTLETIDNSSKWLRSSITKNNFSPQVEVQFTLKQNQTLEQLSSDIGSTNKDNDWVSLALTNDLEEEDYTTTGGTLVKSQYSNKQAFFLNSVVDNITGEKVYGKDIYRKLTFESNDLKVLTYKETIFQSVDILAGLRQGDTPEFPQNGIQAGLAVGSNRSSIPFPVLLRQYYATFRTNDALKNLKINNIKFEQTGVHIEFQIETRLGEVLNQISTI